MSVEQTVHKTHPAKSAGTLKPIVVVGVGMIGSRHADCFRRAGRRVVTVDGKNGADFDRAAAVPNPTRVDTWVVAVPTSAHLPVLREILDRQPNAHILLEKPACDHDEIADLDRIIRQHPDARVVVNDVYAYSESVRRFASLAKEFGELDQIRKITVEFTKNRQLDVSNGRFVDTGYGEAGYEFFHMLSILRSVLPADQYRKYLRVDPITVTPEMRVRTLADDLPEVELYSSSAGVIGFPALAAFAFTGRRAMRQLARSRIPWGDEMRYRVADVEFRSGRHVTLTFECSYGSDADYKNKHSIHVRDIATHYQILVAGNHFEEAILTQSRLLRKPTVDTELMRLPEHDYLARLARPRPDATSIPAGSGRTTHELTTACAS